MPRPGMMGGGMGDSIGSPSGLDEAMPEHEAAESPAHENAEQYGAKLVADIVAAGKKHGLDEAGSRIAFADMMRAAADCLSGGGESEMMEEEQPLGDEDTSNSMQGVGSYDAGA